MSGAARSYRELPLRLADFSAVHRNEISGALGGLTRLRHFHQDDAHIFCGEDDVQAEIEGCLDFVRRVYGTLGFALEVRLSTRPDAAGHEAGAEGGLVGSPQDWDRAEEALALALTSSFGPGPAGWGTRPPPSDGADGADGADGRRPAWGVDEGEGAFYGPKIDVVVTDAVNRKHQCATIQLDFQLPRKFDLKYRDADGATRRPIMIHRAILGSLERFIAMALEQTAGKWPLWLSPRQCAVLPVSEERHGAHAEAVARALRERDIFAEVDAGGDTLKKRIREAQLLQFNYVLVVGDEETDASAGGELFANVRTREGKITGQRSVAELAEEIVRAMESP
jgi:threonyl-tRNA synthetase